MPSPNTGRQRGDQPWKVNYTVDGWELMILVPGDYSLITDFELISPTGERFLGSAGTPEMVRRLIDGDDPDNRPFWGTDLVLVDELSADSIVAAARTLIQRGEVERALDRAADDSDGDGAIAR